MGKKVLAVDLGASGGRTMGGQLQDGKIQIEEIHRFVNEPVTVRGTMYWDILRIYHEILRSLTLAKQWGKAESIAVDTWGVDYGLLDRDGQLIGNPVHYRDARTNGVSEEVFKIIPREELYRATGNQLMEINTAFQLYSDKISGKKRLSEAETMLPIPDLLEYFLGGRPAAERSIASTSQLFNQEKGTWSYPVIRRLGLSEKLFPPVIESGTAVGEISEEIRSELGLDPMQIIAVCGHDTQSAQAAVPAEEKEFLFLSCGTWSLMGTELERPLISEKSFRHDLTNEAACGGKTSFLKNITGLWVLQESRRQWIREGTEYSFGELEKMAEAAEPFACFIDTDAPEFGITGNLPEKIREYCRRTDQKVPETVGAIVRCIDESLAMKYRKTREELEDCTGKHFDRLYIVGGGVQSALLCRMAAGACGCEVCTGPVEATVLGNVAVQLMALGEIHDLAEARELIRCSQEITSYAPQNSSEWDEAYQRYLKAVQ